MPRKNHCTIETLKSLALVAGVAVDVERVSRELAAGPAGHTLELIESSFNDPGPDYSEVRQNGRVVLRINGY